METNEVIDNILIRATPEKVFEMLTDSIYLAKWWPQSAHSEPKEGGVLNFHWFNDSKIETRFESFIQNKEVSFKFGPEFVTIKLEQIKDKVNIKVKHSEIQVKNNSNNLIHIAQSWTFLLINLKSIIEHGIDFRKDRLEY